MTVVTAGIWDASTSFVISLWAREIFTPPPRMNKGFFAFSIMPAARLICPAWTVVGGLYPRRLTLSG